MINKVHSLISRKDLLALFIILIIVAFMLSFWSAEKELRLPGSGIGDSINDVSIFSMGRNYAEQGFLKLKFLPDVAAGEEEYHPLYQAHDQPLTEILSGVFYKLGLQEIKWQRLVAILWTALGLWFFYLFAKKLFNADVALLALVFYGTNIHNIYWGDNFYIPVQFLFVFISLYCFLKFDDKPPITTKSKIYFALVCLFYFLVASASHDLTLYMAIFFIGSKFLIRRDLSLKFLLMLLVMPLVAYGIRNLLVIDAIGIKYWFLDLRQTLSLRIGGVISPDTMEALKDAPIRLAEPDAYMPPIGVYIKDLVGHLIKYYGYFHIVLLFVVLWPLYRWNRRHIFLPSGKERLYAKYLLLFLLMSTAWFIIFHQHTYAHLHSHPLRLFAHFVCLFYAVVALGLWQKTEIILRKKLDSDRSTSSFIPRFSSLALVLCLFALAIIPAIKNSTPLEKLDAEVLRNYKGEIFAVTAPPPLVQVYTEAPAGYVQTSPEEFIAERSVNFWVNPRHQDKLEPDYFFCPTGRGWEDFLDNYFQRLEEGSGYVIYDLRPLRHVWTKTSHMDLVPDRESDRPWGLPGGILEVCQASDGILTMKTDGTFTAYFTQGEVGFDNEIGSTVEVKLKLLDASLHGFQGACIALQNGEREGKLSFYPDHIIIRDANTEKASFEMDTMDDFHIYRLAMIEDTLRVYVDGEEVAGVALKNEVNSKAVMFGDLSPEEGENIYAEIDYISYSIEGAFSPGEAGSLDSW